MITSIQRWKILCLVILLFALATGAHHSLKAEPSYQIRTITDCGFASSLQDDQPRSTLTRWLYSFFDKTQERPKGES